MKKIYTIFIITLTTVLCLGLVFVSMVQAAKPIKTDAQGVEIGWEDTNCDCNRIKDGTILDSADNPIELGYDEFGYNYQAHMFNGTYDAYDRIIGNDTSDYADDKLIMKWSDAWLANVDCNGDFKLDRGLVNGIPDGISKGWLTNHLEGDYDSDGDGIQDAHYTSFTKIVWVGPGGSLWGQYEIIEDVYNDPVGGFHGLQFKTDGPPGFGLNDKWTQLP